MAIRCSELNIPAAIGVGDKNFEKYKAASTIRLNCNSKNIDTISIKTNNLQETFDIFESKALYKYSVAWLDTSAQDIDIGRGLVSIGDFSTDGDLSYVPCSSKISIPSWTPSLLINKYTVKIL